MSLSPSSSSSGSTNSHSSVPSVETSRPRLHYVDIWVYPESGGAPTITSTLVKKTTVAKAKATIAKVVTVKAAATKEVFTEKIEDPEVAHNAVCDILDMLVARCAGKGLKSSRWAQ